MTPEPEDKLDVATTSVVVASGPEDASIGWRELDWRQVEVDVRRLRQRIFTAAKAGDLKRVRRLQTLMLRSRSNTLVSVRRVTERNSGRLTAGVDGVVIMDDAARLEMADRIQRHADAFTAMPVRRVFIPKPGGKQRPLGIPVIIDRVHQARVVNALEPEWEARFEPRSYGFRPGRGCHDAIEAVFQVVKGPSPRRRWVLDADLAGAFDRIGHDHLMCMLGTFPARGMIRAWLKAGVVEHGRLTRTEEGTPQGGVISPLLLNVALHGMEQAAGVHYRADGSVRKDSPLLVRYADDFVVHCHTRQHAIEVKTLLVRWLEPRGLAFNDDKTRVVSIDEGFDFLGFNVRRYHGRKTLIKPSKAAIRRIRERLRVELRSLRGANAQVVIKRLNPIVRGWAAYYRTQVSSATFSALDEYLWRLTFKWAKFSHGNKPIAWVFARHFGRFNKARQDRWVFGDRDSGAYLHRFSWTHIVRHPVVKQGASPDDPTLADYWTERRRKAPLPANSTTRRLLAAQAGRCHACQGTLIDADHRPRNPQQWEQWLLDSREMIMLVSQPLDTPGEAEPRLIHTRCRERHHAQRDRPKQPPAQQPPGLARAGCRETGTSGS